MKTILNLYKFFKSFIKKIQNNDLIILSKLKLINQEEFEKQMKICQDEYYEIKVIYQPNKFLENSSMQNLQKNLEDTLKSLKSKTISQEEKSNTIIFPTKKNKINLQQEEVLENQGQKEIENNINIIDIKEPKFINISKHSLKSYYEFYVSSTLCCRLLPVYVKEAKTKNNIEGLKQASIIYTKLYKLYKNLSDDNYSIISQYINEFKNSFVSMAYKFSLAGISIQDVNFKDLDDNLW